MRILVVTMHKGNNFGSALQAYALSEVIKKIGHTPIILDYIPPRIRFRSEVLKNLKSVLFSFPIRKKYSALRGIIQLFSSKCVYDHFFKENTNLTKPYYSIEQLQKHCPKADIYLTGSDQVWNSYHNRGIDHIFYLDFTPKNSKKISYAASFGKKQLDEWEIPETRKLLQRYQAISVREKSAIKILNDLEIPNGKLVLDPTLLLTSDEWRSRIPSINIKEKYLLIYSVEPNKIRLIEYAKMIAQKLDLQIYLVEWGIKKISGVDKMLSFITPLELMSYFDNAAFIIASSFHGTAWSINLNKHFISIAPEKFSSRAKDLLNLLELSERYFEKDNFQLDKAMARINYEKPNQILEKFRKESKHYLIEAINKSI